MNSILEKAVFDTSNPEPRCPCVLLIDVSGSMSGTAIEEMNNGLLTFQQALKNDCLTAIRVEVAVVSFGSRVAIEQDFITADQFQPKKMNADGMTPMGEAINLALDMVRQRKDLYRKNGVPYYRPWIFLITDGAPTDEWRTAAQRIKEEENKNNAVFFAIGVQGADMSILSQIAVRHPVLLNGLNFKEMFLWLSQSLTSVSHSQVGEQVPLPPLKGWAAV